ncbi:MAG: hypothetical protein QXS05_04350 [Candidatus Bathyarchaeia archaeon]
MVEKPLEQIIENYMAQLEATSNLSDLRILLESVCSMVAEKFGARDAEGRPRIASVLDALLKYPCLGCIVKSLRMLSEEDNVDLLYRENHSLAINLLTEALRARLAAEGYTVEVEVSGRYGRLDVLIRPTNHGVIVYFGESGEVLVEVKSRSFSYSQIIRYLVEHPNTAMVIWRILPKQVFIVDGRRHRWLILASIKAAIGRGLALLREENFDCAHKVNSKNNAVITDAEGLVNDFLSSLEDTLPRVVEAVCRIIKHENTPLSQGV